MYAYKNKAYVVYGLIKQKYDQLESVSGALGYPQSDELDTVDKKGRYNSFEFGEIYWNAERGTFEVHGDIFLKWKKLGGVKSFLGWPTTNETSTPDKIGRYNHFQNGSIYWHPCAGAFEVHGLIRDLWAKGGWEKGYLGYPLSDESVAPDTKGRFTRFQKGYIIWHPQYGTFMVQDQIYHIWKRDGGLNSNSKWGYPKSFANCGLNGCNQTFEKGTLSYTFSHTKDVDLRNEINMRGIAIRDQGGRGTCSVQAMAFLLEYAYTQMCGNYLNHLSVEYLNHEGNKVHGTSDDGDYFSTIADGYDKYGVIQDWRLPYNKDVAYNYTTMENTIFSKGLESIGLDLKNRLYFKGKFIKPNESPVGLTANEFESILYYLDRGVPVALGRGHSMAVVGYQKSNAYAGGGRFLFRNSYGTDEGENGYQWEDFQSVKNTANDVYVYEIPGLTGYQPVPQ
ncbi:MAG: hypothetical protein HQK49_01865 [Oligoflexia bacterium]|nr:hypothetical protein [Oligoflexia bacterium]